VAFWDGSAIVPLCCSQVATARGRGLLREFPRMVVWWGTPVETRSAVARLTREGRLTTAECATAVRLLTELRGAWDEIVPSEKLRSIAERLPDDHGIRAADAFQLAAALVWCRERPRGRTLICFDERLRNAAAQAGFTVRSQL
jgi:uncharacterized protein